jgi:pimeloyl-ACP methyl ester carboxylesterase
VHVDEHTIQLDDSPIYYRTAEPMPDVPPLYLHGIPTSSDDWIEFLATTGGIAPDLIGFGRSSKGGHLDFSLDGLTDFVEDLLSHLGVREVRIVGHDWGGAVGLKLAGRNPGRVRRLVLCNTPPLIEGFEWPLTARLWRTRWVGELAMGATSKWVLARALRRGAVRPDAWSRARIDAIWGQFDQGTQRAILRLVRSAQDEVIGGGGPAGDGGGRSAGHDGGEDAKAAAPIAVIWGEADPWYPPALGDAYAARLPGASIERIPGAGHWPWLDRPEVVERVAALLDG